MLPIPPRRISRTDAFAAQGVTLTYPQHSWSGIREDDGAVVIAMREADIESALDGFRCLLWSPAMEGAAQSVYGCARRERLKHCRLAVLLGGAEGLLVAAGSAQVERDVLLSLRVELRRGEYWALWGSAACAPGVDQRISGVMGARQAPLLQAA
jgi:hypothetical protein